MMEEMQQDKVISEDFSLPGQLPYKSLPAQNQALKTEDFCFGTILEPVRQGKVGCANLILSVHLLACLAV